jgi:hypothetical protein
MVTGVLMLLISVVGMAHLAAIQSTLRGSPWAVYWALVIVELPLGFLVVLGARKMLNLEMFGMARLGCILALLPVRLSALLGIPIGIWALMSLSHPKVRSAFRTDFDTPPPRPAPEAVRRMLLGPRRGLLTGSILVLLAGGFLLMIGVGLAWQERNSGLHLPAILIFYSLGAADVLIAAFMLVAARSMTSCRHHGLARFGSMLALLPFSPFFFLTFPIGLWALNALKKPMVLDAFGMPVSEAELQTEAERKPAPPSQALRFGLFVGGFTCLCLLLSFVAAVASGPPTWTWYSQYFFSGALVGLVLGSLLFAAYSEARRIFGRKPDNQKGIADAEQQDRL